MCLVDHNIYDEMATAAGGETSPLFMPLHRGSYPFLNLNSGTSSIGLTKPATRRVMGTWQENSILCRRKLDPAYLRKSQNFLISLKLLSM